eukprot:scaffold12776_cov63-Phaeocystis_antarctica.AAC.4
MAPVARRQRAWSEHRLLTTRAESRLTMVLRETTRTNMCLTPKAIKPFRIGPRPCLRGAGSEKLELQLDRQTALFSRAWRTAATLAT